MVEETYSHLLKSITINNVNLFCLLLAHIHFVIFCLRSWLFAFQPNPRALLITIFKSSQVIMIEGEKEVFETWRCIHRSLPEDPFFFNPNPRPPIFSCYNSVKLSSVVVSAHLNISDCIILYLFLSLFLSLPYSVWCLFKKIIFCFSLFTKKQTRKNQMMNENNLWKTVYHHLSLLKIFSSQNQRKTNKKQKAKKRTHKQV